MADNYRCVEFERNFLIIILEIGDHECEKEVIQFLSLLHLWRRVPNTNTLIVEFSN